MDSLSIKSSLMGQIPLIVTISLASVALVTVCPWKLLGKEYYEGRQGETCDGWTNEQVSLKGHEKSIVDTKHEKSITLFKLWGYGKLAMTTAISSTRNIFQTAHQGDLRSNGSGNDTITHGTVFGGKKVNATMRRIVMVISAAAYANDQARIFQSEFIQVEASLSALSSLELNPTISLIILIYAPHLKNNNGSNTDSFDESNQLDIPTTTARYRLLMLRAQTLMTCHTERVMSFSTPSGYIHMLRHLAPDLVLLCPSLVDWEVNHLFHDKQEIVNSVDDCDMVENSSTNRLVMLCGITKWIGQTVIFVPHGSDTSDALYNGLIQQTTLAGSRISVCKLESMAQHLKSLVV